MTTSVDDGWEIAAPEPAALIESLRAFGYSPETAIADLIDNSVSAKSHRIDIVFHWDGRHSHVAVIDDGRGMSEATLSAAMRPGSTSPLQDRKQGDLGRFGLGLKTASFSQARELSVLTRTGGHSISSRRWDLDEVAASGKWKLLKTPSDTAERYAEVLGPRQGTAVVWTNCDRLVGSVDRSDAKAHHRFLRTAERTGMHLSLVFHRFMIGRSKITLTLNGRTLLPRDPFLQRHSATQNLGQESLAIHGQTVVVVPYVLPHRTKLSEAEQREGSGLGSWSDQQGFYVYRDRRLVVASTWLGLDLSNDEHTKLARISISFPSTLDHDWQIDVKKSAARPPGVLNEDLRRIATMTRARAEEVYRHRGKQIARQMSTPFVHAWLEVKKRDGGLAYQVNRKHPVVVEATRMPTPHRQVVQRLLRFVEETVPMTMIGIHLAAAVDSQDGPYQEATGDLADLLQFTFDRMVAAGSTPDEAIKRLSAAEPFAGFPHIIQTLKEEQVK